MRVIQYSTPHGITVTRTKSKANYRKGLRHLLRELDTYRGFYLSSGYEFPGRYSRWDFASTKPPLEILAFDRRVEFRPLNVRGEILTQMFLAILREHPHWESFGLGPGGVLAGTLKPLPKLFSEEERSKQPSVFSILRALIQEFHNEQDSRLGLIGAFGYDLLFQFEPIEKSLPRSGQKDLHLFFCDEIYSMDRKKEQTERYQWDFELDGVSTLALDRSAQPVDSQAKARATRIEGIISDHA